MNLRTAVLAAFVSTSLVAGSRDTGPKATDLTPQFRAAGLAIDRLQVYEIGGIVLIRGRAVDASVAEDAGRFAQSLGYTRVANLVQVVPPPDDAAIERLAERALATNRSLDGCTFRIDSEKGVVHLGGRVRDQLQKDFAISLVRNIDGVREVHSDLERR